MSRISGIDTKPEIKVRRHLHSLGFRYRKNVKELPGKPDIVLPKHRCVIFVHGCFWHGHPNCRRADLPERNKEFWKEKISKTILRDREKEKQLKVLGWRVLTVWQCEIRNRENTESTLNDLVRSIMHG
jgi:DNA mismatch endonuclease (patch repair protein)